MTNNYYEMAEETERDELQNVSLYFVMFAGVLAVVLILSKVVKENPKLHSFFSEPAVSLLTGMFVSFCIWIFLPASFEPTVAEYSGEFQEDVLAHSILSFSPNVFFMGLLPPIIFNSGYQLRRELFYRHFKPIVSFACIGTTIGAISTGLLLYLCSTMRLFGQDFVPDLIELLTFGSLIAATDTVSVLGVFQAKKVDPHLFYLVFGESALNDAVALVLFSLFSEILLEIDTMDGARTILMKLVKFMAQLLQDAICSPLLGFSFSMGAALLFKHVDFREQQLIELPLLLLLMYVPFVLAECFEWSGIVAIFFCGISARRYVAPNVSSDTQKNAEVIFQVTAFIAETCIFIELGLSVFGLPGSFNWRFILCAFLASLLGRAIGIYPLAWFHNFSLTEIEEIPHLPVSPDVSVNKDIPLIERISSQLSDSSTRIRTTPRNRLDKHIPMNFSHMLWFAGLRGAVGTFEIVGCKKVYLTSVVRLAYACVRKFPNARGHTDEFTAATMVIVLVSIVVMGGLTEKMLQLQRIRTGVDVDEYMVEWKRERQLTGRLHRFGTLLYMNDW